MRLFQWMFSLAGRLCSEGKRFWLSKCDFCHLYLILRGRGTHVDFLRFIIVSGRHYLPSDARAFSLTSLWNVKLFMRLNDGFRLFQEPIKWAPGCLSFSKVPRSWIWKIINDCIFVRKSGSGRVLSGFRIWPKYCAGIGKTIYILTGSGIWLFPGKRDSPKIGHGMRDLCLPGAHQMEPPSPIQALGVNPFPSRFIIRTVPRGDFARRRWEEPITTTKWHCYCTSSNSRKFGVDRPNTIIS